MALPSRKPRPLTIVLQTSIIMLIFCFAGCAAGSCLNYGHSCWGAHGKRSDVQDAHGKRSDAQDAPAPRILAAKALLSRIAQHGVAPPFKMQWFLTRLIAGPPALPLTDKYHVRWSSLPKDRTYASPKWERGATLMDDDSVEPIRAPTNNENVNNEDKIRDAQDIMRGVNEKADNTREIFLVSSDVYDKLINNLQKLDIVKFLSERNGNTK